MKYNASSPCGIIVEFMPYLLSVSSPARPRGAAQVNGIMRMSRSIVE